MDLSFGSRIAFLVATSALTALSPRASAGTFERTGIHTLSFSGEITAGDAKRLEAYITEHPDQFIGTNLIALNSPGGDVAEALQLAALIESARFTAAVEPDDTCASACFLLLAGSSVRLPMGTVALHRPYVSASAYDDASVSYVASAQRKSALAMTSFLRERMIPERLLQHMNATPSRDAYVLKPSDVEELRFIAPPWEEVLIAQCDFSNADVLAEADGDEKWKCAYGVAMKARVQLLSRFVSPEVSREAVRTAMLAAGGRETDQGRITFDPPSTDASGPNAESPATPDPDTSESAATPRARPETLAALEQIWQEFSSKAKAKDIAISDPIDPMKRIDLLYNDVLPRLARRGDAKAAFALGTLETNMMKNLERALGYFKLASELGMAEALGVVAMHYEMGEGTPVDKVRALAYYSLAEERGVAYVREQRQALVKELSAAEVQEADALRAMLESKLPANKLAQ